MPNSRAKGVAFEREVAKQFEAAGFTVRGLESGGDLLVVAPDGRLVQAVECKRAERVKIHEWLRQVQSDVPHSGARALVFRRNREPAYAVVPFDQYLRGLR